MSTSAKKAGFVAMAATAILAASVATAFAAPVLPAGTTSGPHNSRGTCSNCHTYAAPPVVKPPVVTPPVVTPPVVTQPVVTPPVVTPPVVAAPTAGHDNDGDDKPAVKKAEKKHHKKAKKHHHKSRHGHRD